MQFGWGRSIAEDEPDYFQMKPFGHTAEAVLRSFFSAGDSPPESGAAARDFRRSFVEPEQFLELVGIMTPPPHPTLRKRVVLIDGHPRSGKTTAVLAAIARIADELRLKEGDIWTSGIDSLKVFSSPREPLTSGIRKVRAAWQESDRASIYFLDDFIGTNVPRGFLATANQKLVRRCFTWDRMNPLLSALPGGAVLVVTGRSFHFTLLDILYGVHSREATEPSENIEVVPWRSGLFRTFASRDIYGSFSRKALGTIFEMTLKYHRCRHNSWLLLAAAPILAFLGRSLCSPSRPLEERERSLAARVLFGEDIESVARHIEQVWSQSPLPKGRDPSEGREIERKLLVAYMLCLAPRFLFLESQAYDVLGIKREEARRIAKDLYLGGGLRDAEAGRLPNEFYMVALRDHLEGWLPLATKVFAKLCLHEGSTTNYRSTGMAIRALLERCLSHHKPAARSPSALPQDLRLFLRSYLERNPSFLLSLEAKPFGIMPELPFPAADELNPGLAANLGWILYKFFDDPGSESVRNAAFESLKEGLRIFMECDVTKPVEKVAAKRREAYWNTIAGCYSTFLQWVIRMGRSSGILDRVSEMTSMADAETRLRLQMILEDEIMWALLEQNYDVSHMRESGVLLKDLGQCIDEVPLSGAGKSFTVLNRFFSLCWHNGWMCISVSKSGAKSDATAQPRLARAETARKFLKSIRKVALKHLRDAPHILDWNLSYHWCHFATQYALWMRDWTMAPDPDVFERNRIACGSSEASDNNSLMDIAEAVMQPPLPSERTRNLLFLLGTRAKRLPERRFHTLLERIAEAATENQNGLRFAVLSAIFELHRQGYLRPYSIHNTKEFSRWCRLQLSSFRDDAKAAWGCYVRDLALLTHPLDFQPSEADDLRCVYRNGSAIKSQLEKGRR